VRYVTHAVHAHQQWHRGHRVAALKHHAHATMGRLGMLLMK
jgi:hypothetical protein